MNRRSVSAIILAAGSGQRLGGKPKAFLKLKGKTLLERAVALLRPFASEIIVGVRHEDIATASRLVPRGVKVLVGGATRQMTVSILAHAATHPLLVVHEVARPFTSPDLIANVLKAAARHGAAVVGCHVKARDSLGLTDGPVLGAIVPRSRLVALQTPHAYRRRILLEADERATKRGWQLEGTAMMVQRAGFKVRVVLGSAENLKITYKEDLTYLKATARRWG